MEHIAQTIDLYNPNVGPADPPAEEPVIASGLLVGKRYAKTMDFVGVDKFFILFLRKDIHSKLRICLFKTMEDALEFRRKFYKDEAYSITDGSMMTQMRNIPPSEWGNIHENKQAENHISYFYLFK